MKLPPQISILMPAYNAGKYLQEAIDSMLNQTFTDFELFLLDDCSTDNTEEIVKMYSDKRIQYIRQDNNIGLANNLNVGLKLAKGKYIARMDGDDISYSERLQIQYDFLESHPDIDLCSCGLEMFGKDNQVWIRERDPEQVKITMMFYSPILHATSMWRQRSFEKYNLYYNQDAFPAEDYDLWSRAIFHCTLVNIPQVLYKYRIHGVQVTKTDIRSAKKSKDIQFNYILKAIPSFSVKDVNDFIDDFLYNKGDNFPELNKLKSAYLKFVQANIEKAFFNPDKLKYRFKRYYQNMVFSLITKEKGCNKIKLICDLRFKQILKLIIQ